jgi:hemolysin activation/secretion protein
MERPDDVKQLGLNYRIPLYQQSAVVGMSYTNSDVVGSFGNFKSTGAGQTYGVNVNLYLPPNGGYRAYGSLALDEKLFNASKIDTGGVVTVVQADRTSRPLTLGYSGRKESDTAYWGYGVDLALNLPGGPGNNLTAYQTEDARIMTDRWTALHANLQYLAPLARGWLWSTRLQLQYSADALIAGEQFGLGGATSVRGSSERAVSGDSGLGASFEVTSPEVVQGLRLVGFWDSGWLRNNNAAASTVKAANDQLASVGLGARYALGTFNLTAEWGRVVTGATEPLTVVTGLPKVGDEKLHVNMTVRF